MFIAKCNQFLTCFSSGNIFFVVTLLFVGCWIICLLGILLGMRIAIQNVVMKIGIALYKERVSPVFDTAVAVLKVEIKGEQIISREEINIDYQEPVKRIEKLKENDIQLLICGAVSELFLNLFDVLNLQVCPFVAGDIEEVIKVYMEDKKKLETHFAMPGCCGRRKRRRGSWHKRRN